MKKRYLAVLAGVVAGIVLISLFELLSSLIYPPDPVLNMDDPETLKNYMANLDAGPIVLLLFGYAVSAFISGFIASVISRSLRQALIVGTVFTIGNLVNLSQVPHPVWLAALSTVLFIPCAVAGGKIGMTA